MPNKRIASIVSGFVAIALVSLACGLSVPSGLPSEDAIATRVAETMTAMPQPTADPQTQPTLPVATDTPSEPVPATQVPAPAALGVAFRGGDGNVYYWSEAMSSPLMVSNTGDVERALISPDGQQILLLKTSDYYTFSLEIVRADGTGLRTLVSTAGFDALPREAGSIAAAPYQVTWLADSRNILFTTNSLFEGPGLVVGENIYKLDSFTGDLSVFLVIEDQFRLMYYLSPDQTKIAVSHPEGINLYNMDGSLIRKKVIEYPFVNTASEYAWVSAPVWSPDSNSLVAAVPPQDPWTENPMDSTVWRISSDGSSSEKLFSTRMVFWPAIIAAISPDHSKLLYLTRTGTTAADRDVLQLTNIDGSGTIEYASGNILDLPSWSTDGSKFYFYDQLLGAFIGLPGGSPIPVSGFSGVTDVTWVDETRFIGAAGPEGGWRLLLGNADGPAIVIFSTTDNSGFLNYSVNR